MKTDFDFTTAGKQMPYTVPDGFFDEAERKARSVYRPRQRVRTPYLRPLAALTAMAAMVAAVIWFGFRSDVTDTHADTEALMASYESMLASADTDALEFFAMAYVNDFDDEDFDF